MTEINEKVKYFTQRRLSFPGQPGKFEKCCAGHADLYEAVQCAERARAAMLGLKVAGDRDPILLAMDAQLHADYMALSASGGTIELCVVKYTVTNETVEDLGAITMDCVKPKKEVP